MQCIRKLTAFLLAFFLIISSANADWNGSGTFIRDQNFKADRDAGPPDNVISADKMDDEFDNYADGLENTLTRDGQTVPSANLPMNNFRHTGVAAAATRTDYARASQVQDGAFTYLGTSFGTNTVTATAPFSMSAYVPGQKFAFLVGGTNTGAVTLNLNSIAAKAVQKNGAALVAGDLTLNDLAVVAYDGTQFQLVSPARTPVLAAHGIAMTALPTGTAYSGLYFNSVGILTQLPAGTNGQYLQQTSTVPAWTTPSLNIDASNIVSGTIATARLGSGTANSGTVLYGDQTYKAAPTQSLSPGAIGTYVFAETSGVGGATYHFGDTISGGNLIPANGSASNNGTNWPGTGTWQCMGFATGTSANSFTLWLRISFNMEAMTYEHA